MVSLLALIKENFRKKKDNLEPPGIWMMERHEKGFPFAGNNAIQSYRVILELEGQSTLVSADSWHRHRCIQESLQNSQHRFSPLSPTARRSTREVRHGERSDS